MARRGVPPAAAAVVMGLLLISSEAKPAVPGPSAIPVPPGTERADPPAGDIGSAALVENPYAWDGRKVIFAGEAIGEALFRGGGAWLQLNDDAYQWRNIEEGQPLGGYNSGLAVWATEAFARRVGSFGDYRHQGDVLRVRGTFHAACREHGGDTDLHAANLEIVRPGHRVAHTFNTRRLGLALVLLVLSGGLFLAQRRTVRGGP